jgi:O-acetyl-ADP-ribose deacetylase (regulator of RNase III)
MITVLHSDITTLNVDAIVNAANNSLLGGGGVDGAIHRAAGPQLLAACKVLGGCPTGQAKITPGFNLPARWVIHTVGPVWQGGQHHEAELLDACYQSSFSLAQQQQVRSIAFPAISTGVYGFPRQQAAEIAIAAMRQYEPRFDEIIACCFSDDDRELYESLLGV